MSRQIAELFHYDRQFNRKLICGIDEAGRGPLAGPVSVGAVIMPLDDANIIAGINDSKKLSAKKRDELYDIIKNKAVAYSCIMLDNNIIDEINILEATKRAMYNAVESLKIKPELVLIDAVNLNLDTESKAIIKGDATSYNIAAASIIAKVTRDRLMDEYDAMYPEYNFKSNKGYGTKEHIEAIKKYGPCPIHRKTFIKNFYVVAK